MPDHSAVYIGTAFIAGVSLVLVCREVLYPRARPEESESKPASDRLVARSGPPAIVEGIQGCIGNTPLFRIKSLSDETGCEILAKAEVCKLIVGVARRNRLTSLLLVFEWRWPKLKGPCSAQYD